MDIRRKPLPSPSPVEYGVAQRPLTPNVHPPPPPYPGYPGASAAAAARPSTSYLQPPTLPRHRSQPNLHDAYNSHAPPPPAIRAETTLPPASEKPSFYADARHFLGGLIHHPSESTKHYSILRHSHGIVFYRGPTTSVTVSIFADAPLPADRSLWLQVKGFSGKTGMRAKALLQLHDDWINVSPSVAVRADQVDPSSERAWQRDIAKFRKKASARIRDTHKLRETVVARIPPDAEDGYFQLVLCKGEKKVLCRSPVFRVLSTSTDPSSLRGASLTSLPLELGALVLGAYATATVETVLAPVTSVAGQAIEPYRPGLIQQTAAEAAFELSGVGDRLAGGDEDAETDPLTTPPSIENGPHPPFPMTFTARCSQLDATRLSLKLPSDAQDRLRGFFFGWTRPSQDKPWLPIILSVRTWDSSHATGPVSLSQTTRKVITLRFLTDKPPHPPPNTTTIRILGFLHPEPPPPAARTERDLMAARQAAAEAEIRSERCDVEYASGILQLPHWGPKATPERRRWTERTKAGFGSVLTRGQKLVEKVGVRSGLGQEIGGGFYIVRD